MHRQFFLLLIIILGTLSSKAQQLDHVLGDLIIQISPKLERPEPLLHQFAQIKGKPAKWKVKKCLQQEMNIWLVQFDFATLNEYEVLKAFRKQPLIHLAQFNYLLKRRRRPNDPSFNQQWNWLNTGMNNGVLDADIDADQAWDITTGGISPQGDTIVIAVLDDGIDLDHNDLKRNLWKNHKEIPNNGIDDDQNGFIDDFHGWNVNTESDGVDHSQIPGSIGHGTEVSSLVGAVGNNGLQITGINWDIKIMIVAPYGIGSDDSASAIEGYSYVLNMRKRYNETNGKEGAFVVATNSSWGLSGQFPEDNPVWCAFYDLLGEEGIINTVATENANIDIDTQGDIPTTCTSPYLIGVSSSDNRDRKPFFAAFGTQSIDLFAPGENVPILTNDNSYNPLGQGTSYAAPTVAGVVGLLYAAPCDNLTAIAKQNPAAASNLIRRYILEGVDVKDDLIPLSVTGGRLNAHNSLLELLEDCSSCSSLFGVSFDSQTVEDELVFNWITDTTSTATIRYRPVGTNDWLMVEEVQSPYKFEQLQACTPYEFEIALRCDNELLSFNGPFQITTEGCCNAPSAIDPIISDTGFSLEWTAVVSASNYDIEWSIAGASDWNALSSITANSVLSNLLPCTDYDIRVRPNCSSRDTDFSNIFQLTTSGCGACIDSTYCTSITADATDEWIEQVILNDLNHTSGKDAGYGDHTGNVASLQTFSTYPIEIIPGFRGDRFDENYKVWIDYNHDGIFDNLTEVAIESTMAQSEDFREFMSVPGDATLGLTKMRVAMVAQFEAIERTPCATYSFGEIEDYCVNISDGAFQCISPNGIQTADVTQTTADIQWEQGDMIVQYEIRYRPTNTSAWAFGSSTANNFTITDLIPCLEYEYQIKSNCNNSEESDWSAFKSFITICDCAAPTNVQFTSTEDGLLATWDALPIASSYTVFYANVDGSNIQEVSVEENTLLIQGLEDCVDLNIAITPVCLGDIGVTTEFPIINSCVVSTTNLPAIIEKLEVYPNPFTTNLGLELTLKRSSAITIGLYNLAGQAVITPYTVNESDTEFSISLPTFTVEVGIYFVKIETERGAVVRKVVKM